MWCLTETGSQPSVVWALLVPGPVAVPAVVLPHGPCRQNVCCPGPLLLPSPLDAVIYRCLAGLPALGEGQVCSKERSKRREKQRAELKCCRLRRRDRAAAALGIQRPNRCGSAASALGSSSTKGLKEDLVTERALSLGTLSLGPPHSAACQGEKATCFQFGISRIALNCQSLPEPSERARSWLSRWKR